MLEIVPQGVDKWEGTQLLLHNMGLSPAQLMAVGDGGNDYELVANAGEDSNVWQSMAVGAVPTGAAILRTASTAWSSTDDLHC
jgi:hypothetical protein